MVALPQAVDVEKQAGQGGSVPFIPQGKYPAVIVASELKRTSKGGQMIVFTIVITQGDYANTEFKQYVNIVNKNPDAEKIGYQTIANMGKAINIANIKDTNELHNKPMVIEVKTKPAEDWINDKGETVAGKESSEIKKYFPIPANGAAETASDTGKQTDTVDATPASNPFAA